MFATLRKNRTRPPLADTSNASATLAPLKVIASRPSWPSMVSLPSPGSQVKRSSPAPMSAVSLPWLPSSASLPSPPSCTSLPRPPSSVSSPAPPSCVSFIASAPSVLASTRSSPPRALMVRASRAASACVTFTVAARPVTAALPAVPAAVMASLASVALTIVWSVPASGIAPPSASSWLTVRTFVAARSSTLTTSLPPSELTSTRSMPSKFIVMAPTSRTRRVRVPLADSPKRSLAPLPLKVIVSAPLRPSTVSLPSPGSQTKRSSPAPRLAMSLPPLPSIDVGTGVAVEPLSAEAAAQRVVAALPVDARRDGRREGAVGVVDPHLVVAAAGLDADALDPVARDPEVGRAVVADVDFELVGRAGTQAQREPVARRCALDDEGLAAAARSQTRRRPAPRSGRATPASRPAATVAPARRRGTEMACIPPKDDARARILSVTCVAQARAPRRRQAPSSGPYSSWKRRSGPPACMPRALVRPLGSSHASWRPSAVRSR